jgi:hypothetical protein
MPRRFVLHGLITLTLALLVSSWSGRALATPDFPGVVVQALSLPGITIDAPQGCTLCHTTDAGGTSLRPFGHLLQQYGVTPYDEGSLKQALAALEQEQPQLIDDIKQGRDPNDDSGASTGHTPEYGCSLAGPRAGALSPLALAMAALGAVALLRRLVRRLRSGR